MPDLIKEMKRKKYIFLIGKPAFGKTTLGNIMATKGFNFVDTVIPADPNTIRATIKDSDDMRPMIITAYNPHLLPMPSANIAWILVSGIKAHGKIRDIISSLPEGNRLSATRAYNKFNEDHMTALYDSAPRMFLCIDNLSMFTGHFTKTSIMNQDVPRY